MRRFFKSAAVFLCAFIIALAAYTALGALITADANAKAKAGGESQIFAYYSIDANRAQVIAFGEEFIVSYTVLNKVHAKLLDIAEANERFMPSIAKHSGGLLGGALRSAAESFARLPDIAEHYYGEWKK